MAGCLDPFPAAAAITLPGGGALAAALAAAEAAAALAAALPGVCMPQRHLR